MLSAGDLDRTVSDRLVRSRVPHLIVRAVESEILLGPFVHSGSTACLRCLDAHLGTADPTYPAVLAAPAGGRRTDGVAEPLDATVAMLALAWAVGDLVRYTEGERPSTWSSTLTLTGTAASIATTPWSRHPGCGCSWAGELPEVAAPSVTMGA